MLNQLSPEQKSILILWYLVQHSLSSFYKLYRHFGHAEAAIQPQALSSWSALALHRNHLQRFEQYLKQPDLSIIESTVKLAHKILFMGEHDYPNQLKEYDDCPPVLFVQGNALALSAPQISIVGSRKPSPHGRQIAYDFAYYLSEQGFYITSGLALGIDEAAHEGGLQNRRTIAIMGTGLDQTYPSQHQYLRQKIIEQDGAIVTEFFNQTPPLQHHFPRRNRIVSALSLGIIVAEATQKSGSLITAKLAAEQGKTIFAIPGHIYSEYHQGCHSLIREGAILIDHPEQVIEDLALDTQWYIQKQQLSSSKDPSLDLKNSVEPQLEEHLKVLFKQLDWHGQTLDELAQKSQLDAATLTSYLMELELNGLVIQQAGLYLRCGSSQ